MDQSTRSGRCPPADEVGSSSLRLQLVAAGLAVLFVIAAAAETTLVYGAYHDLRTGTDEVRAAAHELGSSPANWTPEAVDHASAEADDGQRLIDRARVRLHADVLMGALAAAPLASAQAGSVLDLADAASQAATATRDAVTVAKIYRNASGGQGSPQRFLDALKQAQAPLEDASRRLHRTLTMINLDRARPLAPPLRQELDTAAVALATAADQADSTLLASRLAPAALGDAAPQKYLVILANPTELRPDGGFAGVVGTITFDHGSPSQIRLIDQFTLNGHYGQRFPIPLPIQQHLVEANNSLEIGDAGWDPDLPTTAALFEQMWQSATKEPVAGTIVVDAYAIGALLDVTGPVTVAPYGSFDAATLLPKLNVLINATGTDKGTAVPAVASAVLKAVLSQPGANYPKLASTLLDQGHQRHLQLSVHDKALQAAITAAALDGAVRDPGNDDYVMTVDANVGATKSDFYLKKKAEIRVEKPISGLSNHEIKLSYVFPQLTTDNDRKLNPKSTNNPGGHYRDYLRIYIPETANLTGLQILVNGKPTFSNSVTENVVAHGKRVIGMYFEFGPGESADVAMTYVVPLPPGSDYHLLVQKQAGRPNLPTDLWLSYPGGQARRHTDLATDSALEVSW